MDNSINKQPILLACYGQVSNTIKSRANKLNRHYNFLAAKAYNLDDIIPKISQYNTKIIILMDNLPSGKHTEPVLDILRKIVERDIRVIFICYNREVGDPLMDGLVELGIYDIINEVKLSIDEVLDMIDHPRKFKDSSKYLMQPEIDDKGNLSKGFNQVDFTKNYIKVASNTKPHSKTISASKKQSPTPTNNKKGFFSSLFSIK